MCGARRWALAAAVVLAGAPEAAHGAATGRIDTVAGAGQRGYRGDGGPARSAQLDEPRHVAVDASGAVYVVDTFNHRVRRVDASGTITTVAGSGAPGYSGDGGPAGSAQIHWPHAVALDPGGTALYIADTPNHRIRRVDLAAGTITTVAGSGTGGYDGDGGPAVAAKLNGPKGLAVGPAGELYIADSGNDRIRRVDAAAGTITTVAGTGATGYGGDGGPASQAVFDGPRSLAVDAAGHLYVADDNNGRVRRIDPSGVVVTYAGAGQAGYAGDGGPAAEASLNHPRGVAVDGAGNLYIADSENHCIRMVDASGTITTIAGTGRQGFGGDGGPSADSRLFSPRGVAVDAAGNLFVADTYNSRIRRITAS